jgi:hypothetical protein
MPILDNIVRLEVDDDIAVNELTTLNQLFTGLQFLAGQVAETEAPIRTYEETNRKRVTFTGFGNLERFGIPSVYENLLTCQFHWFGNTLCNFVRLVGFVNGLQCGSIKRSEENSHIDDRTTKKICDDYVNSIQEIEPILFWRNKVFAHFAITDPRKSDNSAGLDLSVMSPVGYMNNRFRLGGWSVATRGDEFEMPSWSVTETFEALGDRFWPEILGT